MTYDPWADLRGRPDITFGITELPAGEGWWLPQIPAIVLDRRLSRVQRRCVLAHELVHADNSERQCAADGCGTPRIARRRERDADEIAARRLIPLDRLVDALRWALSPEELAEELDVTERLARLRVRSLSDAEKVEIETRLRANERGSL